MDAIGIYEVRANSFFLVTIFLSVIIFSAGCCGLMEDVKNNDESIPIYIDEGNVSDDWGSSQGDLTGGIHGTVTDLYNAPLGNASVMLLGNNFDYIGLSDSNGNYNISGVPEGIYTLVASKEGYGNMTIADFSIIGGYPYSWDVILSSSTGSFHGTIKQLNNATIEDANVSIFNNDQSYSSITDENGNYHIEGIQPGTYDIIVHKLGYKNVTVANSSLLEKPYSWNATISRDCIYYNTNTSVNYVLRYGFDITVYHGDSVATLSYPQGAKYEIYPGEENGFSETETTYLAGNRMLKWTLDNSEGDYSYVEGHLYMDMNGTGTMQVYNNRQMGISDAKSSQSNYLGSETRKKTGEKMIDPSDSEISRIAQQVKSETGSEDTWTVAKALFIWLKNNTVYYIDAGNTDYSHLPSETLQSGRGKCDELAHLYISMLRSVGIPSRFVKGYVAERNPQIYISHRWVEFYDGEWVPVEVAGNSRNSTQEADTYFGVRRPDHIAVFVDDGTDASIGEMDSLSGIYYDKPALFPSYTHYDAIGYDQKYIAVCADGTRELKDKME